MYTEEEYLMISGMQHFAFCRRQWALIHIDCVWQENRLTAEGELLHKNAHNDHFVEKRQGVLVTRGMKVASATLGMTGQCDVVEFIKAEDREAGALLHKHRGRWKVCPVEYKHGKDKLDDSDKLQLCCEAMGLEEMLACHIQHGYLYYHEIRRRRQIDFTPELREKVKAIAEEMHQYFRRRHIPRVKPQKCCKSCSLKEMCLPKLLRNISVKDYYHKMLQGSGV